MQFKMFGRSGKYIDTKTYISSFFIDQRLRLFFKLMFNHINIRCRDKEVKNVFSK